MTPDYVARLVERKFDQLDMNGEKSVYRFNKACTLLEENIHINFYEFEETELVRKWAKDLCDHRVQFDNWYRNIGWIYQTKELAGQHFPNGWYFLTAIYYVRIRLKRK